MISSFPSMRALISFDRVAWILLAAERPYLIRG